MTVLIGQSQPQYTLPRKNEATISHSTIREQIIAFLTYEYHIKQSPVIKLNYSKKEMAERLGVQRTSLSCELNKMRRDGLLDYDARTITLKSMKVK